MGSDHVLDIKELKVEVLTPDGIVTAVRGINLTIGSAEIHGIVGESGCGKSMTMKSVMRLHEEERTLYRGSIHVNGKSVLDMKKKELLKYRGKEATMIFQNPMNSLNPIMKTGEQIAEILKSKYKMGKKEAKEKVLEMFRLLGITPAEKRYDQYPYEMSGGLIQRVVIAMAIICNPKLIIADEPTTALDVTIQAQILELIKEIRNNFGASIVFITHDLGVVAEICDRISVMYAGRIVESGSAVEIFDKPSHPYTKALLNSNAKEASGNGRMPTIPGMPPSLFEEIKGCAFYERCQMATEHCRETKPKPYYCEKNHYAECHYAKENYKACLKNSEKGGHQ